MDSSGKGKLPGQMSQWARVIHALWLPVARLLRKTAKAPGRASLAGCHATTRVVRESDGVLACSCG